MLPLLLPRHILGFIPETTIDRLVLIPLSTSTYLLILSIYNLLIGIILHGLLLFSFSAVSTLYFCETFSPSSIKRIFSVESICDFNWICCIISCLLRYDSWDVLLPIRYALLTVPISCSLLYFRVSEFLFAFNLTKLGTAYNFSLFFKMY